MNQCSAWCQPEKDIHVWLSGAKRRGSNLPSATQDELLCAFRRENVGSVAIIRDDLPACIPARSLVLILAIDPAPEAPPFSDCEITFLETVQIYREKYWKP